MQKKNLSAQQILDEIRQSDVRRIKVAVTDFEGVLRGKYMSKEKFLSAAEGGFGFCNVVFGWDSADVCYDNVSYTGWHTGYPDAQARIDLSTYRRIPWEDDVPFFLAEFVDEKNSPLLVCPRQLLRSTIQRARDMGFEVTFACEFEFFNFNETPQTFAEKGHHSPEPLTPGMFGYSILRSSLNQPYFAALMEDLGAFDVPIEGLHTETGPGVYEAAIQYSDALTAADRAVLFKTGAKEIAYRFGIIPSFMAKWDAKLPGCGGHIHQSVWKNGRNVFYDEKRPFKMSPTFEHYLAGQMHCAREILPFYVPNINSFKRLTEGLWAPTKVTWGAENRTASFRVIPGGEKSTRLETRLPGADMNPYLAISAALASGLYGIEHKLELQSGPVTGNAYAVENVTKLPRNLFQATEILSESKLAREILGEQMVRHMVETRFWEWRQFQEAVTDWELKRYFEII